MIRSANIFRTFLLRFRVLSIHTPGAKHSTLRTEMRLLRVSIRERDYIITAFRSQWTIPDDRAS